MTDPQKLTAIRDAIQIDPGNRGLATHPERNMFTACPKDVAKAGTGIAGALKAEVGIITGFYIPSASAAETDGPLGAVFLAQVLTKLKIGVSIGTDSWCLPALKAGLFHAGILEQVRLVELPKREDIPEDQTYISAFDNGPRKLTHLIALERVGPSCIESNIPFQPWKKRREEMGGVLKDQCFTMKGIDISPFTRPAWLMFEESPKYSKDLTTIGIGDGGNEIGMGLIPRSWINLNIPNGEQIGCWTRTDLLIVTGVSNWGAYAVAAGVALKRKKVAQVLEFFSADRELEMITYMVKEGPLVDGVTGKATPTVDGLTWEAYTQPLEKIREILEG